MAEKYVFLAGQLRAIHLALAAGQAADIAELEMRLELRRVFRFTDEEKKAIGYREYEDNKDRVDFDDQVEVTRSLTTKVHEQLMAILKKTVLLFHVEFVERWLGPAMAILGDQRLSGEN